MYATIGDDIPRGKDWTFEPKYDGMRVLAFVDRRRVRLMTRNGHDKAAQFPEIVALLRELASRAKAPLILDGEVVALERGHAGSFQALQTRMHLKNASEVARRAKTHPATLITFDLLRDGTKTLIDEPWRERRAQLERLAERAGDGTLRLSETSPQGARIMARAKKRGWEGVIAKRVEARYVPGARSRDWLKLKLLHRAEFVVGGFTEPRRSRQHIGALLLGYFDDAGRLCYAGSMGGGFDRQSLREMYEHLRTRARKTSPFADAPRTAERAHWVKPDTVVEVKFAEWTADGKLRQPIYLGVREDKEARDVQREAESMQDAKRGQVRRRAAAGASAQAISRKTSRTRQARPKTRAASAAPGGKGNAEAQDVARQIDRLMADEGEGTLRFSNDRELDVTNLSKPYFGKSGPTKGDLLRYYATISPVLLPLIADRPLVLKRYPNGISGSSFFQQNAGEHVPDVVRVADVDMGDGSKATRIIGGDLPTLLYTVQIGAIAVHAWLSRLRSIHHPDWSIIDLDPGDDVPFARVVELARDIRRVAGALGVPAAVKTSGAHGIHVAVPLPPRTSFERSAEFAARLAARIVEARPDLATTERRIKDRPKGTIYVDAQQNAYGKSVVSAYAAREKPNATVSAPLRWSELKPTLRLTSFTVQTMPARVARIGDVWSSALRDRARVRTINEVLAGDT